MPLSTWPATPLPIRAEMFISGTWTDITSRVRLASEIIIAQRGRQSEQGRPGVCTCSFTVNNRDAYFSTRAPNSVNYGKLGKNTPFRVSVTEDRSFALYDSLGTTRVKTTDKAVLDVVGDLDIRVEFEPDNPNLGASGYILAAKWRRTASANRSWALAVSYLGNPSFYWSTDGAVTSQANCTAALPLLYGPVALRATMDVDNGAAGNTVTFYTSDTISGTWTMLGTPVVAAGVTSIFSGTAEVEIARLDDGSNTGFSRVSGFTGRVYAFEMRSGIGGTLVANAAISSQPRGTTSWSDGLATPNTWTTNGNAEITPDDRRFTGETAALPQTWDISGRDVYVPVTAADVTRRLQQGGTPILSAWRRYWVGAVSTGLSGSTPITGYWPFEDGLTSQQAANLVPAGVPATLADPAFSRPTDLPASAGAIVINSAASRFSGQARRQGSTAASFCNFAFKMSAIPASSTTIIDLSGSATGARLNFSVTPTTFDMALYAQDGTLLGSQSGGFPATTPPNQWVVMRFQLQQVGGNIQADMGWYRPGDNLLYGTAAIIVAGTAGVFSGFVIKATTQNIGTQFAQLAIGNYFLNNGLYSYIAVASAFAGEAPDARFARVCTENGILSQVVGTASTERMGPQPLSGVMDVLYECSDAEQGVIYPDRNSLALVMRTRRSLINQYGPSISYAAGELGAQVPLPTDDDLYLRNTVTASRSTGSSATASVDSGPNSTASPTATPPGAGVYNTTVNRNVYTDDRLIAMAEWETFLGTWDEPRWPQVRVDLERSPYTGSTVKIRKGHVLSKLDVGDFFTLTGLVQQGIPPDDAIVLVQGLTETLGNRKWWISWNTSPAGPFFANDNNAISILTNSRQRVAAANCTVTTGFTAGATGAAAFQITTAAGSTLWGTTALKPANFPLNVVIAGEVITLSGITGTSSPQTANVSARGVNMAGAGKAHLAGEAVQVQYPFYVTL